MSLYNFIYPILLLQSQTKLSVTNSLQSFLHPNALNHSLCTNRYRSYIHLRCNLYNINRKRDPSSINKEKPRLHYMIILLVSSRVLCSRCYRCISCVLLRSSKSSRSIQRICFLFFYSLFHNHRRRFYCSRNKIRGSNT